MRLKFSKRVVSLFLPSRARFMSKAAVLLAFVSVLLMLPTSEFIPDFLKYWTSSVDVIREFPSILDKVNVTVCFFFDPGERPLQQKVQEFGPLTQVGNIFSVNVTIFGGEVWCIPPPHWDNHTYNLGELPEGQYQFEVYVNYYYGFMYVGYWLEKSVSFTVTPRLKAEFTYSPPYPIPNATVTFDASVSVPGWNGTHVMPIESYEWDFGDGNTTATLDPIITHKYIKNDTYNVNLNVTDSQGSWNSTTKLITVHFPFHDVTVTNIDLFVNPRDYPSCVVRAYQCYPTWSVPYKINITLTNLGDYTESFNVTAYYQKSNYSDGIIIFSNTDFIIGTQTVTNLAAGETMDLTFIWPVPPLPVPPWPYPLYSFSANASVVPGETNIANNVLDDGSVVVKWPGDINGDGHVDLWDLILLAQSWYRKATDPHYPPTLGGYNPQADFDMDGKVELIMDLILFCQGWFQGPFV